MTREGMEALEKIANAIIETVNEVGERGSPAGPMYMALNGLGLSLDQFYQITDALVQLGKIKKRGHLFYPA